jgi:Xaa-Pro aminopeptidase
MTTSNEPGYYEDGNFGIRIENVCVVVEANTPKSFGASRYCRLETITFCPIQKSLINFSLMSQKEINWLNAYHAEVREKLLPSMREIFPEAVDDLIAQTEPYSSSSVA